MRPVFALMCALVAFAAVSARAEPSSTYIELRHDGSQDHPYPLIWLGDAEHTPTRPSSLRRNDAVPAIFTYPVALSHAQYAEAAARTDRLECQPGMTGEGWDEVSVTRIDGDLRGATCILQGKPACDYVTAINAIAHSGARIEGADAIPELFTFLGCQD